MEAGVHTGSVYEIEARSPARGSLPGARAEAHIGRPAFDDEPHVEGTCGSCGSRRDDPDHLRLEWGAVVSAAQPGLSPFWKAAVLADAFISTQPAAQCDSMIAQASRQLPVVVSAGDLSRPFTGGILADIDPPIAIPPPTPPPPTDYEPNYDELPEGAVALSGYIWAEVSPGVWKWVLLYITPEGISGFLVLRPRKKVVPDVPPTPEEQSWCCCPLSIRIEGHRRESSVLNDRPFAIVDESKKPAQFSECEGTDFDVVITVKWVPSDTWKPCTLRWYETSSRPHHGIAAGAEADLYDLGRPDREDRSEHGQKKGVQEFNQSPVFTPWWWRMDADYPMTYSKSDRKNLHAWQEQWAAERSERDVIRLNDTPCFQPHEERGNVSHNERALSGRVEVHSGGCAPPCEPTSVEASWAQYVRFNSETEQLEALFFETDSYEGPRQYRPSRYNQGGVAGEEANWINAWKRTWRRRR